MKIKVFFSSLLHTKYITENANNFLNNDFRKKTSIIYWNYSKNTTIYENLIKIDLRKDPYIQLFYKSFMFDMNNQKLLKWYYYI